MPASPAPLRPPGLFKLMLEARAPWELVASAIALPMLANEPRGDGHPVIVYPGFVASDFSTAALRGLLGWLGYEVYGWKQGRNLNPTPEVFRLARAQIRELHARHGRKISLVGWSLGGLYAREFAKLEPDHVRSVISLGSPFAGSMHANNASRLFHLINRGKPQARVSMQMLHKPPPVPTTSIYSRSDGIVAWQCSVERAGPLSESIQVHASHTGMGMNPMVLHAIADRLAQPEGQWVPFERTGYRRLTFPRTHYPEPTSSHESTTA